MNSKHRGQNGTEYCIAIILFTKFVFFCIQCIEIQWWKKNLIGPLSRNIIAIRIEWNNQISDYIVT